MAENSCRSHFPLYQKLISAKAPEYVSQNRQILDAIHAVYRYSRARGIFVFDRGHDRSRIYEKALCLLDQIRWIVRINHNRSVKCSDARFFGEETEVGLKDLAKMLDLSSEFKRTETSRKTSKVSVGHCEVIFYDKPHTLIVIYDPRNSEPVLLLTNISVKSQEDALWVWAKYLDRWGKEEGYRLCQQALGHERIRAPKFHALSAQSFLVWCAYAYICWVKKVAGFELEQECKNQLKHFKDISEVKFKYYRYQQALSLLLKQEREQQKSLAA